MPRLPLFVFGTLRRDQVNHHYLDGRYERMIPAELHGYARIHPLMIVVHPSGRVDGELYLLKADVYDETMRGCDDLEDIPPGALVGPEYRRKRVTVVTAEGEYEAWAYVHPDTPAD